LLAVGPHKKQQQLHTRLRKLDENDVLVGAVGATGSVHGLDEAPTNVYGTQPKIKINEFAA